MLQSLKQATKRGRSLFNPCSSYASTSASASDSASTSSSFHYYYDNPATRNDVAESFKSWFRTRNSSQDPLLTHIFQTLSSSDSDAALSSLPIPPLSEPFVLRVLRHGASAGHVLPCLRFFDWAGHQPNFRHTRGTFFAIFQVLSRARLMPLILDFLDAFRLHGRYFHRVRFHDTLVMGYAVAGEPEVALQLFGKMRFQGLDLDSFAYHVLLNSLVEENYFNAFDAIVKQIKIRGYVNRFTNALVVKSLCKQGKLDEAEGFLHELVSDGVELHGCEVSVLVGALCRVERVEDAVRVVREFEGLGVVPLNNAYEVWLKRLTRNGMLDEALEFLKQKRDYEGYVPSLVRYNALICRLLRRNRLGEVYDLLMDMMEAGVPPSMVTMNAVLCFFCKAGFMDVALHLYNLRSQFNLSPNCMAYKCLILALCWEGSFMEAFSVLKSSIGHGYFPGKETFNRVAIALCRQGKLDEMKELLHLALVQNYMPSASTYNRFIMALCQGGRVEDGYLLHGARNNETARESYMKMIRGFQDSNRGDIAARLLVEMKEKGHIVTRTLCRSVVCCILDMENSRPHFFNLLEMLTRDKPRYLIYNFFIDGAGHAKKAELAREVFELMQRNRVKPKLSSHILMIQAYLKSGRISDALNYFSSLRVGGMATRKVYNALIVGLCKSSKPEIAHDLLIQMLRDGYTPSIECFEVLVQKLCSVDRYHEAINLVNVYEKMGRRLTSFLGNVLLFYSLGSQEVYNNCVRVWEVTEGKTYGSSMLSLLIGAFSGRLRVDHSIKDMEELIEKCFPLDIYTYNLLLRKASMNDMVQACELFHRMGQKGYVPNRWTYDTMVQGFSREGRKDEAKRFLEEMFEKGYYPTQRTRMLI